MQKCVSIEPNLKSFIFPKLTSPCDHCLHNSQSYCLNVLSPGAVYDAGSAEAARVVADFLSSENAADLILKGDSFLECQTLIVYQSTSLDIFG